jgi:formate-dependent nitrite reductase membrane component NrfD
MEAYEWMVEYTPQTEWIDQKGIFVWLAEVFTSLGSGLYLVSLYFSSLEGMLISLVIVVVLKCGFHFAHLSRPLRFWRMVLKPKTSWLARGFIFLILFIGFGAIQVALSYWQPGTAWEVACKILAGVMAVLVATYTGFVMNYINGIPFWNSGLLPLLFLSFSILSGLAGAIAIGLFGGNVNVATAVSGIRWLLVVNAFFMTIYFWSATYMGPTGKRSVKELTQGRIAPALWLGVVLVGIFIPLGMSIHDYIVGGSSVTLLITMVSCVWIGGFSFIYCILKGALYTPLIPV